MTFDSLAFLGFVDSIETAMATEYELKKTNGHKHRFHFNDDDEKQNDLDKEYERTNIT